MKEFYIRKYEYYRTMHQYRSLISKSFQSLLITHLDPIKIKNMISNPTNEDELDFAYEYLNLAKMLASSKNVVTDASLVKPLENLFFRYVSYVIKNEIEHDRKISNTSEEDLEGLDLDGLDNYLEITNKMSELGLDDIENYFKVCAESALGYLYFFDEIINKSINFYIQNSDSAKKYLNPRDRLLLFFAFVKSEAILFDKERLIVGNEDVEKLNIVEGTAYLKYFQEYIKSLQNTRNKIKTDNA